MKYFKKVAAVFLSAAMLAGCGGGSKVLKADGKTLRFASELDVLGMDTALIDDGMSFNAIHACIDGLEAIGEDGTTVPGIAESYKVKNDTTYTFKLRKNAVWVDSEGNEVAKVTANDFVFAWKRILKEAGNYAYMFGSEGANIKGADEILNKVYDGAELTDADLNKLGVKAKDDHTLVVKLAGKVPYFIDLMTFPCYYPYNQKFVEEAGDQYGTSPEKVLSNGAFRLTSWDKSATMQFSKNDKYYDAKKVNLDTLQMYLAQKPQAAAQSFDAGNFDYATITSEIVDSYKDKDVYTSFNEGYLFYLQLNFKNDNIANENIRKALSFAINRQAFCDDVLKDGSQPAKGFVPAQLSELKGKDFRKDSGSYTSYDVKKANEYFKKGLKELGVDSLEVELLYGTDESPMDDLATFVQSAFSEIEGLTVTPVATTKQDRIYNRQANGDFQVCCTRWGPDYADPTTYLNLMGTKNSNNYGKYTSKEYDKLMKKIQNSTDLSKRWELMKDAEKIIMDDVAVIPVFEKGGSALQSTKVSGLVKKAVGVPYTFKYVKLAE